MHVEKSGAVEAHALIPARPPNTDKVELTAAELIQAMNNAEISNSIVVYLRLVASAFLKTHQEEFAPFLFAYEGESGDGEPPSMESFCANHIEAIGKEADHLAITALSRALLTSLEVVYFTRGESAAQQQQSQAQPISASPSSAMAMPGKPSMEEQMEVEADTCDTVRFDMPTEPGSTVGTADSSIEHSSTQVALLDIGSLLFRPGHYDVLVKAPKLQNTPSPVIPKAPPPRRS